MRVKQTAKKITTENANHVPSSETSNEMENIEQSSCDNQNDISDNEVEFLVECRRDDDGNQFLLDGTLVIEPAAVDISHEYKENQDSTKEINFDQFIKEMEGTIPHNNDKIKNHIVNSKRNVPSFGPDPSIYTNVKCTACNNKFNPSIGQTLFKHPLMEVVLCSDCIQNQKDEFFVIDKEDNKETLCRWCVEGGSLICCDFCPKSFCKSCIKRNLGRVALTEILNQDDSVQWRCFACDPKPIEPLKIECRKIYNDVREFADKQQTEKLIKKPVSRLSEIVNKKRSIAKAFPNDANNGSPNVTAAKLPSPHTKIKHNTNTGALLSSMANFGTEWYMRNVKLRNIFTEIDEIDSRTLLNAINSTKKCVEAFYSDIRNLEVEISKASTASDIPAVVSMFKSVYRHHIFNRFCQVKARIDEDRKTKFPGQPLHNGNIDFNNSGIKNTNSIPSLVINNVVSTAPGIIKLNSFTPNIIAHSIKHGANISNGGLTVMASIDLTDEPDKMDEASPSVPDREEVGTTTTMIKSSPANNIAIKSSTNNISINVEEAQDDIVDLCDDEDSKTYPIVNINANNPGLAVDFVDRCEN